METSVRDLKANLSAYIQRAAAGEAVTIRLHKRPVARIVPIQPVARVVDLAKVPGLKWNGGKPKGLARGQLLRRGVSLSAWVSEDRR